jgi:hypothetical protein
MLRRRLQGMEYLSGDLGHCGRQCDLRGVIPRTVFWGQVPIRRPSGAFGHSVDTTLYAGQRRKNHNCK